METTSTTNSFLQQFDDARENIANIKAVMKKPRCNNHRMVDRIASVIFFLVKAPRTVGELAELLGKSSCDTSLLTSLNRILTSLENEGLVTRVGVRPHPGKQGRTPTLWAWTPPESMK